MRAYPSRVRLSAEAMVEGLMGEVVETGWRAPEGVVRALPTQCLAWKEGEGVFVAAAGVAGEVEREREREGKREGRKKKKHSGGAGLASLAVSGLWMGWVVVLVALGFCCL